MNFDKSFRSTYPWPAVPIRCLTASSLGLPFPVSRARLHRHTYSSALNMEAAGVSETSVVLRCSGTSLLLQKLLGVYLVKKLWQGPVAGSHLSHMNPVHTLFISGQLQTWSCSEVSRFVFVPTQLFIHWAAGTKWPGRESDHWPPSGVEIKYEWSCTPTGPYTLALKRGSQQQSLWIGLFPWGFQTEHFPCVLPVAPICPDSFTLMIFIE